MSATTIPFKVIKGTEAAIKQCLPIEGHVWFALDTRKIYYSDGEDFISMGGNSSVFYGTLTWSPDNLPDTDQVEFDFTPFDIEGNATPNANDLILNSDGCFYRVMSVDGSIIHTNKLTIAGSGGGGIPGGGGTITTSVITIAVPTATKYFLENESSPSFTFSAHSTIERNNRITKITYTIGTKTFEDDEPHSFGDITVDLSKYFNTISENGTNFSFVVEDIYGAKKTSSTYLLKRVKLILTPDITNRDDILQAENKLLQYKVTPSGTNDTFSSVTIHYNIYIPGSTSPIASYEEIVPSLTGSAVSKNLLFSDIDTINDGLGAYSLEVYCSGIAGGQLITSNILTHSVISYAENPILVAYIPDYQVSETFYVSQYDSIDISYEIAKSVEDNQKARITFNVDGTETVQEIDYNNIYKFNIYFETTGFHNISIADSFGHVQSFNNVYVNKYDGTLQVIDNGDIDLKLNLAARGRTNNEIINTRTIWADTNRTGIASLENFVWGTVNGWLTDDKNVNMLRLSSGAKMTINGYEPFGLNANHREGMETGKSIELDFCVTNVTDYSQPIITCLSYDSNDDILCGFHITGEAATFNTHKIKATGGTIIEGDSEQDKAYNTQVQGLTSKFAEGERIHLTWVIQQKTERYPMIKTYINGIVSGITEYTGGTGATSDSIAQNTTTGALPALIKITSDVATVDVYNIRVYDKTLSDRQVLENYIATLSTTEEKAECYASNIGLLDSNGKISVNNIESGNYNIKLPYIKLTGGGQCRKGTKDDSDPKGYYLINADGEERLPRSKKDFRLINHFDFVYPTDTNRNVDLYSEVSDEGLVNGVVMYGQGTSSMEYPVKNLRIKFKMKKDGKKVKFQVNQEAGKADYPVDILTLKADYMESSSSHNTGTANLVFSALEALGLRTPGQTYWNTENPDYKTLTAIRGYPIICFFRPDEDSDFEFIGRYNLNMDKSSEDAFGFLPVPESEEDIASIDDIEFGWMVNDGTKSNLDPIEHPYINAIHCYEFLNNASHLDNFICPYKYRKAYRDENKEDGEKIDTFNSNETYYIKDGDTYIEVLEPIEEDFRDYYIKQNFEKLFYQNEYDESDIVPNWFTSFESRYPEDSTDIESFYQMCAWLNSTCVDEATNEPLDVSVVYNGITYTIDNREYRLAKFTYELEDHFNKNFVLFYYVITHVLLMIDSRAKNMMIATWDNQHWFPIFYDMDTMLGLNNYGYNKFDYNVEDKDENVFNGQASVLWNNLKVCFASDISAMYENLQAAKALTYDELLKNYNEKQADMWNEIMYNYDATYKYIEPFINGYYDGKSGKWVTPGAKNYLYAAQGSRSMHRKYWLKNRISYFDGKYLSGAYKDDKFTMRLYTPAIGADNYYRVYDVTAANFNEKTYYIKPNENENVFIEATSFVSGVAYYLKADNRLANSLGVVPPNNDYTLTPLHNQYLSVAFGGANGQTSGPWYAKANTPYVVAAPAGAQYNDTETYVYGASQIKDLGDLSPQYLGLFSFPGETKLERLVLGNKTNGYYNPNFSALNISEAAPQLKYLDISNTQLTGDLSLIACQNIEEVYACGSSITSIGLPSYGVLRTLRLPISTTSLVLDTQTKLTNENFTIGTYDSETETYTDEIVPTLQTISIEGMPQFDSYGIVKKNCEVLQRYCLRDINWEIGNSEIVDTVNNDGLKGIYALERLIARNAQPQYKGSAASTIKAVTGSIIFGNDISAEDMLAIYEHYSNIFPDLLFVFDETNIKHINLFDGDGNIYWTKPITAGTVLTEAFYESSASGAFTTPRKTSTIQYQYTFENKWYIDNDNSQEVIGEYPILENPIEDDINFYPVFSESLQNYTIIYHINDGIESYSCPYGTAWIDTLPKYIPYSSNNDSINSNNLQDCVELQVYPFLGYSVDRADAENIFDFDSNATFVSSNREFFAIFGNEKVSAKNHQNVFYPAWDIISKNNVYVDTTTIYGGLTIPNGNSSLNVRTGYIARFKADWTYHNFVTIPSKTQDGLNYIYKIESPNNLPLNIIDKVYCESDTQLRAIENSCFKDQSSLTYFDFPSSLRQVGQQAFTGAKLINQTLGGENTIAICDNAFNNALSGNTIIIPSSVSVLGNFSCSYNDSVTNWTLYIGDSTNKSELDLSVHLYFSGTAGRSIFGYNISNSNNAVQDVYFYTNKYNSWNTMIDGYNILTHFFGDNAPAECTWHIG